MAKEITISIDLLKNEKLPSEARDWLIIGAAANLALRKRKGLRRARPDDAMIRGLVAKIQKAFRSHGMKKSRRAILAYLHG